MCDGCDAFVRERGGAIRAAAVLQTQSYRLSREEFDDLVYSAILRVIERKQTDPQIVERPNRYFHRIVENLSIDNYREARHTVPLEYDGSQETSSHVEIARRFVQWDAADRAERLVDVNRVLSLCGSLEEREAILSVYHEETAKEFAERRGLSVEAAKKRRQRAVTILSKKLEGGF